MNLVCFAQTGPIYEVVHCSDHNVFITPLGVLDLYIEESNGVMSFQSTDSSDECLIDVAAVCPIWKKPPSTPDNTFHEISSSIYDMMILFVFISTIRLDEKQTRKVFSESHVSDVTRDRFHNVVGTCVIIFQHRKQYKPV